ncbi:MAG: MBL fold metallo-hydrolase [Proteobacteria bacterium]|nr:MBL fold metallo-hydrolase [Pseudomonadota bacterium]
MRGPLSLGKFKLYWLKGGAFELDGGAMFGVVPKALWSKKYPVTEDNYIPMVTWPILIKTPETLILLETGLGNKLTEKQKQIYRVKEEWNIPSELNKLGFSRNDIEYVILTHFDFDHSGGAIMRDEEGHLEITFPLAKYVIQTREWHDVLNPNRRSINTYWAVNNEKLRDSKNLMLIEGEKEIIPGIKAVFSGGHNGGHQIVIIESESEMAIHLGDLMPMHSHYNPLWVMAYDNFPMESIKQKEKWEDFAQKHNAWLTFYHDPFVLAGKFNEKGELLEKFY